MAREDDQEGNYSGYRFLRLAGPVALIVGAVGSVGFFLYASQQTLQFLKVLFRHLGTLTVSGNLTDIELVNLQ